jgi:hypothetical protein
MYLSNIGKNHKIFNKGGFLDSVPIFSGQIRHPENLSWQFSRKTCYFHKKVTFSYIPLKKRLLISSLV